MSHEQDIHPFAVPTEQRHHFNLNEYEGLLNELNQQVRQKQPDDLLQFCSSFFLRKLENERAQHRGIGISSVNSPFGHQDESMFEEDESRDGISDLHTIAMSTLSGRGRRTSVSAESLQPTTTHDFVKTVVPKTDEQRERIRTAIGNNFLFKNLDEEQYVDVVNAMVEKLVNTGCKVIEQGGVGDYFYIVESGTLDCLINGEKVTEYTAGGSFGELALMYNAPRAATIVATSDCVLWALDRVAFRMILMENTARKRRMYDQFLSEVPIFKSLEPYERHKIADALEPLQFENGQVVIKENDVGENFYLIESGNAIFYKTAPDGTQQEVNRLSNGDYFGELALLNDKPRAATVVADGKLKCVTLGKKAFTRLLGPVMDILQRNSENYHAILRQANQ
ncbi:cAMP dependent protein kinase regulatory subunit [Halteromyces radiatus]|uniref:cAMP dependent protein kinase regulatory subunit n=1 Tax=Halteromyces radiatus TaxID=101107 RepID=UPI002220081E|nr:cAMP dependent protein kinase regulatory subunit [Halteromyces radiatus]KAI8093422.1 cAMP dependent protein kinase regulatory subunit [Halteromyces radiatus]